MIVTYPWTVQEWHKYLHEEFVHCRALPGWPTILSLHDEDDQEYISVLEDLYHKGKIKVNKTA